MLGHRVFLFSLVGSGRFSALRSLFLPQRETKFPDSRHRRVRKISCNRFLMSERLSHKYFTAGNERIGKMLYKRYYVAKRVCLLTGPFKQTVYSCHLVTDILAIIALS